MNAEDGLYNDKEGKPYYAACLYLIMKKDSQQFIRVFRLCRHVLFQCCV